MQVGIHGAVVATMSEYDCFSVATFPASMHDNTIASGLDWCSGGRCIINTFMSPDFIKYWMFPAEIKTWTDTGKINRGPEKRLAHGITIGIVVIDTAVEMGVANGANTMTSINKLGS